MGAPHRYEKENDGHIDLVAFCRWFSPAPEDIGVHVSAASDRPGFTIPEGSSTFYGGARLKIRAVSKDKSARFLRWDVNGEVELKNSSSNISLRARGNGSVTAVFSPDQPPSGVRVKIRESAGSPSLTWSPFHRGFP